MTAKSFFGHSAVVAACLASSIAPLAAQEGDHYSAKELQQRMGEANTAAQYQSLASYLRKQEDALRGQAQEQKVEYQKWAAQTAGSSKFPTRADTARRLYQEYSVKADHMAQLAGEYEARLRPSTGGEVATKSSPQLTPAEQMMFDKLNDLEKQVKDLSKR